VAAGIPGPVEASSAARVAAIPIPITLVLAGFVPLGPLVELVEFEFKIPVAPLSHITFDDTIIAELVDEVAPLLFVGLLV